MLHDLLHWWLRQMRGLAPAGRGAADGAGLVVRACGGLDVEVALRRRGQRRVIGAVSLDDAGLPAARALLGQVRAAGAVLELPGALLLEQEAVLPIAAEAELGSVLHHEMDRLTPFSADEVFWNWSIAERDRGNGRLRVRLSVVLKAAALPLITALARAGVGGVALEAPGADGVVRHIGTLPPGTGPRRPAAVRVAAWACAVLAVGVAVTPVMQQQWALADADSRIAALRPQVVVVDALRQRLAAASSGAEQFAAVGARSGNAVQAMAAITRALPDDTYLTELSLRDRKVTLTGRSAAAVRLIGLLSAVPELVNPAFAAPVIRTIGERGDQFTISADLAS